MPIYYIILIYFNLEAWTCKLCITCTSAAGPCSPAYLIYSIGHCWSVLVFSTFWSSRHLGLQRKQPKTSSKNLAGPCGSIGFSRLHAIGFRIAECRPWDLDDSPLLNDRGWPPMISLQRSGWCFAHCGGLCGRVCRVYWPLEADIMNRRYSPNSVNAAWGLVALPMRPIKQYLIPHHSTWSGHIML